jgi:hypothetical protein
VSGDAATVAVRFQGTPVREFLDLQEAIDGYQRELQLAAVGGSEAALPATDASALLEVREAMSEVRTELHDQAARAREAGQDLAELVGHYPVGARQALLAVMEASRHADEAAQRGRFLGPPLPDRVRGVQIWMYRELLAQLDGADPTPFADGD